MMRGIQTEEIRNAILSGYTKASLTRMLQLRLDKVLLNIVPDGKLDVIVSNLFETADREGWDTELVREAHRFNPGNVAILQVYEKYGLAPQITLQQGGIERDSVKGIIGQDNINTASSIGLERIIRVDNPALDIAVWRTRLAEVEVRTCRIDLDGEAAGTGFLIGPEAVLTNYHVVESVLKGPRPAPVVSCLFDYKRLADGTENLGARVPLHSDEGIVTYSPYSAGEGAGTPDVGVPTEMELDFALLRLARPMGSEPISGPGSPPRGFEILPDTASRFVADQGIIIAQHPAGAPMKLTIDAKSVLALNANGTRVRYRTNTERGSSGSPVFSMLWKLVALHHYGDPAQRNQPPQYNQGIAPLHSIRSLITAQGDGLLLG